jgi:hypothetical protein
VSAKPRAPASPSDGTDGTSSRNILLVVLDPVPGEDLRAAVEAHRGQDDVTVHVVAPAANAGMLEWITGDEDKARAEAAELATATVEALEAADAHVEAEVGDRDLLLAVEDALSLFPADEIVLAGQASEETEAALRRLGLPVSRLNGGHADGGEAAEAGGVVRDVARGQSPQTPFVLLGVVGGVVLGAIAFISLITLLIVWLA